MKKTGLAKTVIISLFLVSALVCGVLLAGCSGTESTESTVTTAAPQASSTTAASAATTAASTATTAPTSSTAGEPKELAIGLIGDASSDVGVDQLNAITMVSDNMNAAGGITVGDEQYKIKIISYDSGNSQTGETEATNRLVYQDKVKFIISQGQFVAATTPITDKEKVLVLTQAVDVAGYAAPGIKYTFNACASNPGIAVTGGWFCENMPEAAKNIVCCATDNPFGHMVSGLITAQMGAFGAAVKTEFFPETAVDLSSLATKVMSINPSSVTVLTGNGQLDGQVFGSIRSSGYNGQLFINTKNSNYALLQFMSVEDLEGFICSTHPMDFDPCPLQAAQEFKDAWIAKYGEYTGSAPQGVVSLFALITALENAGTLDTDAIADLFANGLTWESPFGSCKMVVHPLGDPNRTGDSISTTYIKKIHNGESVLLAEVPPDKGYEYFLKSFGQ